jgi:hypothetical protein
MDRLAGVRKNSMEKPPKLNETLKIILQLNSREREILILNSVFPPPNAAGSFFHFHFRLIQTQNNDAHGIKRFNWQF